MVEQCEGCPHLGFLGPVYTMPGVPLQRTGTAETEQNTWAGLELFHGILSAMGHEGTFFERNECILFELLVDTNKTI